VPTIVNDTSLGDTLHIAHAGDSVCYLVRADWCKRLTEKQGAHHRLYNCLGNKPNSFYGAQYVPVRVVPQDLIVFGTDGLDDYVQHEVQLAELAAEARAAVQSRGGDLCQQFAGRLIRFALEAGGNDNVTVVVVQVV
jgi:serine/threonine protein phosphatase PrpC